MFKEKVNGFISIYRKIQSNEVFKHDNDYKSVWYELLYNVEYKATKAKFKGEDIILQPGQIIISRYELAKISDVDNRKIRKILEHFEKNEMITRISSYRGSLITVTNWNKYQIVGTEKHAGQQRADSNKSNAGKSPTTYANSGYGSSTTKANTNKFNNGEMRQDYNFDEIDTILTNKQVSQLYMADEPNSEDAPMTDEPNSEDAPMTDEPNSEDAPMADEPNSDESPMTDEQNSEDAPMTGEPNSEALRELIDLNIIQG